MIRQATERIQNTDEDRHDVFTFLHWLTEPGSVLEIRVPKCPERRGGKYKAIASGYFDDVAAAVSAVKELEQRVTPTVTRIVTREREYWWAMHISHPT